MKNTINREEVGRIEKKLNEARVLLQQNKLHSSLVKFKESLETLLRTKMLPSDSKDLNDKFNHFQALISNTPAFTEMYGAVAFRDNDAATTLEFVKQLLIIKDEEIKGYMEEQAGGSNENPQETDPPDESEESRIENLVKEAKSFIDSDDYETAKDIIGGNDEILWWLLQWYNTSGIEHRRQRRYREALHDFKKALALQSDDEGLYYNIARIHIELKDWKEALAAIQEALKINPEFQEGKIMESFLKRTSPPA